MCVHGEHCEMNEMLRLLGIQRTAHAHTICYWLLHTYSSKYRREKKNGQRNFPSPLQLSSSSFLQYAAASVEAILYDSGQCHIYSNHFLAFARVFMQPMTSVDNSHFILGIHCALFCPASTLQ